MTIAEARSTRRKNVQMSEVQGHTKVVGPQIAGRFTPRAYSSERRLELVLDLGDLLQSQSVQRRKRAGRDKRAKVERDGHQGQSPQRTRFVYKINKCVLLLGCGAPCVRGPMSRPPAEVPLGPQLAFIDWRLVITGLSPA